MAKAIKKDQVGDCAYHNYNSGAFRKQEDQLAVPWEVQGTAGSAR